jgi:hypothetical protein
MKSKDLQLSLLRSLSNQSHQTNKDNVFEPSRVEYRPSRP